jgi:hypothetical protein
MKKFLVILFLYSVGFSSALKKIDVGPPKFEPGEISVGQSRFRSGFFVLDVNANPAKGARIQVDAKANVISVKWYQIQRQVSQYPNLRSLLSSRQLQLPMNQISSPILDQASDNVRRNPFVLNWIGNKRQLMQDPYVPTHDEQYVCDKDKGVCFRIEGNRNKPDLNVYLQSNGNGSIVNFVTDYKFQKTGKKPYECTEAPRGEWRGNDFISQCSHSDLMDVKYHPVSLNEFDMDTAYANYRDALSDTISRTLQDYAAILKNLNSIRVIAQSCHYSASMQVETKLTSALVEDIRGQGIEARCLATELSPMRSQYLPSDSAGLVYSAEQVQLGQVLAGIESSCPFETWVGPRNQYKLFKKECIAAGIQRLEIKARQISEEIIRFVR